MRRLRERAKCLLREESGFTLPEMLVTIMLMLVVMSALYSIFDMSIRVFSFGNDKTEAVENARLGLERMEREIRAAYPYDKISNNTTLLSSCNPTCPSDSITFGNDNGDRKIESSEVITYKLNDGCPSPPSDVECNLQRVNKGTSSPVVNYVQPNGLTFEYFNKNGDSVTSEDTDNVDPDNRIFAVHIKLEVAVDRGIQEEPVTQVLETDVALRNRSG